MFEVKGNPIYRRGDDETVVNIVQQNPYTHYERVLNGDWRNMGREKVVEEVLRIAYLDFNPSGAISSLENAKNNLENQIREAEANLMKIEEQNQKSEERSDNIEKILNEVSRNFLLSSELTDEQKADIISQYRKISVGDTVKPNEVVNINDELFRMVQGSEVTIHDESWLTDASLFTPFLQVVVEDEEGEAVDVVTDFIKPTGSHDAYNTGDRVLYNDKVYESTMDDNNWSPSEYPQGWIEVVEDEEEE